MKRPLTILTIMTALCQTLTAQSLKPVRQSMEFGQMLFQQPTVATIELTNTSKVPTTISRVDTGCGCTLASFTKEMIKPGSKGIVTLTFDGKQLGHFSRIVRIYETGSYAPTDVQVNGEVVTKIINYSGDYPYKIGDLLTDVNNIEFDDINQGQRKVQEIHVMNPTGQYVQPVALRLPSYLSADMQPTVLAPKKAGTLYVTLKSDNLRDYGLTQTSFYLGKDNYDKVSGKNEITTSVILLPPAIASDSPQRINAPRLYLSDTMIDMKELSNKSKVKSMVTLRNDGGSELIISKLQLFTNGLLVSLPKSKLMPGETTIMTITGVAKELKRSRRSPRILMITNDPDKQKVEIRIKR